MTTRKVTLPTKLLLLLLIIFALLGLMMSSSSSISILGNISNGMQRQKHVDNSIHLMDYSYNHCPFTLKKFSQYEMSHLNISHNNDIEHSIIRAHKAKQFSNRYQTLKRVHRALESNSFYGRKIILDGDSLTRQIFISLSCLIWNAG